MEVELSRDESVLTITLNRPEVLNALDLAMHEQLAAALEESADPALRAIVVTGAGRGFCVGQDVAEFPADPARWAGCCAATTTPMCSPSGRSTSP